MRNQNPIPARLAALALASACSAAWSQSVPDAGRIFESQGRARPELPRADGASPLEAPRKAPMAARGGSKVFARSFEASADEQIDVDQAALAKALSPFVGRELDIDQLGEAAEAAAGVYRDAGYFLARGYVPEQDVGADGRVRLAVLIGRADTFDSKPKAGNRMAPERALAIARAAQPEGAPAKLRAMERGLLLLGDATGTQARATLSPGELVGGSRVDVEFAEPKAWAAEVDADNMGSRSTGKARAGAQLTLVDPLGLGDAGYLRGQLSSGLSSLRGSYSLLARPDGLRLGVSGSAMRYELGGSFAALGAHGGAREIGLDASYPVLRSPKANVTVSGRAAERRLDNWAAGALVSDKSVGVGSATVSADALDAWGGGGQTAGSLTLSAGRLDLSRVAADAAADASGPRAAGGFSKWSYALSRSQSIAPRWELYGSLSGQFAGKNLDSSEQMSLGGPLGVRGYPVGEAPADVGAVASFEARWMAYPGWRVSGFYDKGWARARAQGYAGAPTPGAFALASAGAALDWSGDSGFFGRLVLARKVGSNPAAIGGRDVEGSTGRWRAWLSVGKRF